METQNERFEEDRVTHVLFQDSLCFSPGVPALRSLAIPCTAVKAAFFTSFVCISGLFEVRDFCYLFQFEEFVVVDRFEGLQAAETALVFVDD